MEASSAGTSATTSTYRHEGVLITFEGLQLFFYYTRRLTKVSAVLTKI